MGSVISLCGMEMSNLIKFRLMFIYTLTKNMSANLNSHITNDILKFI